MKFTDDKVLVVNGHKFAHARVVQGSIIYLLLIGLSISGLMASEKSAAIIPGVIALVYVFNLYAYSRKSTLRKSLAPAFFATICLPTSMIG